MYSKDQLDRIEWKLDQVMAALMNRAESQQVAISHPPTHPTKPSVEGLLHKFTTKQHCVIQMLLRGADNQLIADRMGVSINTAKVHVRTVAKKLDVNTRAQIVIKVYEEFEAVSDHGYQVISGGLPKDWHENYKAPDPLEHLYRKEDSSVTGT